MDNESLSVQDVSLEIHGVNILYRSQSVLRLNDSCFLTL